MPKIFISYRRSDSIEESRHIYDALAERFGEENVFRDKDQIPIGSNFRAVIDKYIVISDEMLVLIGPSWLDVREEDNPSQRRLDSKDDPVRSEVEMGLRHELTITPVYLNNVSVPEEGELPGRLIALSDQNAFFIRPQTFDDDLQGLVKDIAKRHGSTRPSIGLPIVAVTSVLILFLIGLGLLASGILSSNPSSEPTQTSPEQVAADNQTETDEPSPQSTKTSNAFEQRQTAEAQQTQIERTRTSANLTLTAEANVNATETAQLNATETYTPTLTIAPSCSDSLICDLFLDPEQIDNAESFKFAEGGILRSDFTSDCALAGNYGLQLEFDMNGENYGGWGLHWWFSSNGYFDATRYTDLTFWLKLNDAKNFQLSLKDIAGNQQQIEIEDYIVVESGGWILFRISLEQFDQTGINLSQIRDISFGFNQTHGKGVLCVDSIQFLIEGENNANLENLSSVSTTTPTEAPFSVSYNQQTAQAESFATETSAVQAVIAQQTQNAILTEQFIAGSTATYIAELSLTPPETNTPESKPTPTDTNTPIPDWFKSCEAYQQSGSRNAVSAQINAVIANGEWDEWVDLIGDEVTSCGKFSTHTDTDLNRTVVAVIICDDEWQIPPGNVELRSLQKLNPKTAEFDLLQIQITEDNAFLVAKNMVGNIPTDISTVKISDEDTECLIVELSATSITTAIEMTFFDFDLSGEFTRLYYLHQ